MIVAEPDADIPVVLNPGIPETGVYGNNFQGQLDFDGKLTVEFQDTGDDVRLRFTAFDIDSDQEMEILLNGEVLTGLDTGKNDGLTVYEVVIPADGQLAGTNTLEFVNSDPTFTWGLTEIRLDPVDPTFTPTLDGWDDLWHLRAAGDIERVWAEYDGDGISVGIYDDGFDKSHVDLDDNYDASKEVVSATEGVLDPSTGDSSHGTAVAGIIGAEQNDEGVVGIAFNSSLTGVNMISGVAGAGNADLTVFTEAMNGMTQFDVVNHSWGSTPGFDQADEALAFNATALPTFENAAVNGRSGYGTVLVKSAGNDNANSNGDLLDASRFTITVGAHGDDGMVSDYSNYGSNLLVSAPSNGSSLLGLGVFTTDVTDTGGYNTADTASGGDYTGTDAATGFGGTSAAAPVVSGVVALMLEANPELGWRDVQEILAYSSTHTGTLIGDTQEADPIFGNLEDGEWMFNAAANSNGGGLHHSADYGFGAIDVYAAVRMAEVWHMFNEPQASSNEANWKIEDDTDQVIANGATLTIDLDYTGSTRLVETMEIDLNLDDASVDVFLISQSGTRVQILEAGEAGNAALDWSFNAQAFRGEWLTGTWQLEIVNADGGDVTLFDYAVESFGFDPENGLNDDFANGEHEVYHYTDEVFEDIFYDDVSGTTSSMADDAARMLLTDTGSTADWINMAAMTGDIRFFMLEGETASANGRDFVTIDTGTVIENLVTGDGNDLITGNAADNEIHLGRGNDGVYGLDGDDTLFGGAGDDQFWFNVGDDVDVIGDFTAGLDTDDVVVLDGHGLDFLSLSFTDDTLEGSTTLDLGGGDSIKFLGVQAADFDESDFLFDPTLAVV